MMESNKDSQRALVNERERDTDIVGSSKCSNY